MTPALPLDGQQPCGLSVEASEDDDQFLPGFVLRHAHHAVQTGEPTGGARCPRFGETVLWQSHGLSPVSVLSFQRPLPWDPSDLWAQSGQCGWAGVRVGPGCWGQDTAVRPQIDYYCRLDCLWKKKFKKEHEEFETMESVNRLLLENVLPAHVAAHFIGDKLNEV